MTKEITHIDGLGYVRMVDVTTKKKSLRKAVAQAFVFMSKETFNIITNNNAKKGNVLETARIAGIMGAKKTYNLIPMCHSLNLTHIQIDFFQDIITNSIRIESRVSILASTGVEMEALTAVSIAGLTIYDMCKSYDKNMTISSICLLEKSGGKSGLFVRKV